MSTSIKANRCSACANPAAPNIAALRNAETGEITAERVCAGCADMLRASEAPPAPYVAPIEAWESVGLGDLGRRLGGKSEQRAAAKAKARTRAGRGIEG